MPKTNFFKSLSREALEALTEHSLGNYLPFNGGLLPTYGLQNYGKRKEPKEGIKFYAVEYEPDLKIKQSPIYFENENQFKEFNDFDPAQDLRKKDEFSISFDKMVKDMMNNKKQYFKWGKEKGFKFHGYKKTKYDKKEEGSLEENLKRSEEDPTICPEHNIDCPNQSFFKIGLTNTTAKKRGLFFKPNQNANPYKKILIEKDLTYLYNKIHPADVEVFIYFFLFYRYWKERLYFYSSNKINLDNNVPKHQSLWFRGHTESFLYENVEEKINVINKAFENLEKLSYEQIAIELNIMISFNSHWQSACSHKKSLFNKFNFDKGISYKSVNYEIPKTFEKQFFKKIGFWDKWYSENDNQLKELFDKKAEEFILINAKFYPEISSLES